MNKREWQSRLLCLWVVMAHYPFFIVHSYAQGPTYEQLVGTWIGVHIEQDIDFVCPLPNYIRLDADSTYHLGMVDGSAQEQVSRWAIRGESVRFDTVHFAPKLVTVQNDLLRIGKNYPMVLRRFVDIPVDSARAYQQLSGRVWQSDSLVMAFYANGKVSLENRTTKQRTAHFWRLARFGKSVFVVIRGNQYNRFRGYKPLWQLSSLQPGQLEAIGWNGRSVSTERFTFVSKLLPSDSCRPSGFQACGNCFRPTWYERSLTLGQKRYDLLAFVMKQYQPVQREIETGLIQIQFAVNCEGEKGPITLNSFGEDYCPRRFAPQITSQLITICQNYVATDTSLREPERSGEWPLDLWVSLTFRLKEGRITELLP
ncbi:hypothetical protein [Spirosoma aerolatum]|uniref:hypothetical protein n=1 Tax=Spirosoma aerolatum TaxID=1211326 RepID=UPI0015CFCF21|nr:hypothetical protein [Spirosoma aerolatum]